MTQKLQQLQQAIREVCTELKELTFGCEAHIRKGNCLNKYVINCTHHDTDGTKRYKVSCLDDKLFNPEDFTEIIGHPIQLQHILRAMPERSFNMAHIKHGVLLFEYYSNEEDSFVFVGFHLGEDLSAPENAPFVEWAHSIICKG